MLVAVVAVLVAVLASGSSGGGSTKIDLSSPTNATQSLISAVKHNDLDAATKTTTGAALALIHTAQHNHRSFKSGDPAPADLDYKVGAAAVTGDHATVTVDVSYQGESKSTTMKVDKVNGNWLVSDLGLLQGPTSSSTAERVPGPPVPTSSSIDTGPPGTDAPDQNAALNVVTQVSQALVANDYAAALRLTAGDAHTVIQQAQRDGQPLAGSGKYRFLGFKLEGNVASMGHDQLDVFGQVEFAGAPGEDGNFMCQKIAGRWKVIRLGPSILED